MGFIGFFVKLVHIPINYLSWRLRTSRPGAYDVSRNLVGGDHSDLIVSSLLLTFKFAYVEWPMWKRMAWGEFRSIARLDSITF